MNDVIMNGNNEINNHSWTNVVFHNDNDENILQDKEEDVDHLNFISPEEELTTDISFAMPQEYFPEASSE